jgi:hypothetical protein
VAHLRIQRVTRVTATLETDESRIQGRFDMLFAGEIQCATSLFHRFF